MQPGALAPGCFRYARRELALVKDVKRKQPTRPKASGCIGMHRPAAGGREAASAAQRNLVQLAVREAEDRRSDKSRACSRKGCKTETADKAGGLRLQWDATPRRRRQRSEDRRSDKSRACSRKCRQTKTAYKAEGLRLHWYATPRRRRQRSRKRSAAESRTACSKRSGRPEV